MLSVSAYRSARAGESLAAAVWSNSRHGAHTRRRLLQPRTLVEGLAAPELFARDDAGSEPGLGLRLLVATRALKLDTTKGETT